MDTNNGQPQPLGQIFGNSFKLFKKIGFRLFPLTIFLGVVVFSPSLFIFNPQQPLLFVGYFIFSIFVFSAALYYAAHVNKNENIYLTRASLVAGEKLPIILVTTFLLTILTLLAYGFLIVPGIIVTVWFSMCLPLILLDHAGPLEVFRKSYELTTDAWGRTAVVVFLPLIIMSLIGEVARELFIFYPMNFLYFEIILGFFVFFTSLFYLPWVAALLILQFEDLKKRKALGPVNKN